MEEKKKGKGSLIVIILLVIVILGLVGYICYDKGVILKTNTKEVEDKNVKKDSNEEKEENLDINSRLVQSLYNKVAINDECLSGYLYEDNETITLDNIETHTKSRLIGRNLGLKDRKYINCSSLGSAVPESKDNDYISICSLNQKYNSYDNEYAYDKNYVEYVYKSIFGTNAKLDTSIAIEVLGENEFYYYIESLDKYVLYRADGYGGSCSSKTTEKLTKAVKNGSKIVLTENVTIIYDDPGNDNIHGTADDIKDKKKSTDYVYTFKLEDDGMYSFVSRKKA